LKINGPLNAKCKEGFLYAVIVNLIPPIPRFENRLLVFRSFNEGDPSGEQKTGIKTPAAKTVGGF
jgi:hypothetical protein